MISNTPRRTSSKECHTHFIPIIHQQETYEKLQANEFKKNYSPEHRAHGDDTDIQSFQLLTHDNQSKATAIPPMSSSSNEFSFEMAMHLTDTSNEALKTDDENGMTKSYFLSDYHQREKEIIFSDVSLQHQSSSNQCEYEIDLGNGYITKSNCSDQNQQRRASVISADSIQPITAFKMPFTSNVYKSSISSEKIIGIDNSNTTKVLNNSYRRWSKLSFRTVTSFSIGTTIILFLIVILLFVF